MLLTQEDEGGGDQGNVVVVVVEALPGAALEVVQTGFTLQLTETAAAGFVGEHDALCGDCRPKA